MKKAFLVILIIVAVGAVAVYYFVYNKPHRDIHSEKAAFSIPASELYDTFTTNTDEANAKYLNKVISVSGTVSDIATLDDGVKIVLATEGEMFGVACSFSGEEAEQAKNVQVGSQVTIKGLCTGYSGDDIMPGDVVLIKCNIQDN